MAVGGNSEFYVGGFGESPEDSGFPEDEILNLHRWPKNSSQKEKESIFVAWEQRLDASV